jgi:hypothetical protein
LLFLEDAAVFELFAECALLHCIAFSRFGLVKRAREECRRLSSEGDADKLAEYLKHEKHFSLGLDEEGVRANLGDDKIFSRRGKKKLDRTQDDSRVSITIIRTGTAGGGKGPNQYLLSGVRVKPGFTSEFLEHHGAPPGSRVRMTPTGYLTNQV